MTFVSTLGLLFWWLNLSKAPGLYTVSKAMDDFIVNNEKKKHSTYVMKSFIP
jgi:hypothetical protein